MLRVRLLGAFEITQDNSPVAITSRPAQSLFAYLVLNAGTSHRREKLAGMLWPDSLEETARDNLRHALWRVRKALPQRPAKEYLITDDMSISFNASADYWLDAAELGKAGESASADELTPVLSEYQGELLPGFYDEWVVLEREHLQSVFEHKMARLLAELESEGRWQEVLDWAERWIALGQKPEPAYRGLMSAHAAKGDMSKVATTYVRCVRSLGEFGIEPSEQTKELYQNLKTGNETPGPAYAATKSLAGDVSSDIPVPLTSFIGREKELRDIAELLSASRLLTMLGPGGVGKTRLAIQTAHDSTKKFKDGVCWVELAGLQDGSLIPQEIAHALDVRDVSNQPMLETLKAHLKPKELLLVLDNCEHVIEACARNVEHLLAAGPKLKILATSRERLDLFNETTWNVPSLPFPGVGGSLSLKQLEEFASVELFAERARRASSDFVLTEQNASSVVQICNHLDGIPLALELAAARIRVLSVEEIESRLNDRFSLLTSGSRTALPRQQTLRAALDWSHALLTEPERIIFRRLAVFVGGFTLEAAEAVCSHGEMRRSEILDLLGRLVDKSLVVVDAPVESLTHYRFLETIREYALEKLVEAQEIDELRNWHLEFYVGLVERIEPDLETDQAHSLDRLEVDLDNIRTAIDLALISGQIEDALQIVGGLRQFWFIRAYPSEGIERLRTILERQDAQRPTPARLKALNAYFFILWPQNTLMEVQPLIDEAVELGTKLGDPWNTAFALNFAGVGATSIGDYPRAKSLLKQSARIWEEEGSTAYLGMTLFFLGEVALFQDHPAEAQKFYEQSIELLRMMRDYPFLAAPVRRMGQLALRRGHFPHAADLFKESLQVNWNIHDYRCTGACFAAFAELNEARGQTERAVVFYSAAAAVIEFLHAPLVPYDHRQYEQNLGVMREKTNQKLFEEFWEKGKAMTMDQVVAFALEER